jgi:hypothetical protein
MFFQFFVTEAAADKVKNILCRPHFELHDCGRTLKHLDVRSGQARRQMFSGRISAVERAAGPAFF